MPILVAYVDGGSHGNPGPSGIGVVIESGDGDTVRIAKWIGRKTIMWPNTWPCWKPCSMRSR